MKLIASINLFLVLVSFANESLKPDLETYTDKVKPLINKYCVQCHGEKKSKGKMRFDTINPDIISGGDEETWEDFLEQFNTGEMPPEDEKQPTDAEREVIAIWLDKEFKKARLHGSPNKKGNIRRLTRYELKYTLEDLFKVSAQDAVEALPDESPSTETGLKNSSKLLMVSAPHIESYFNAIFSVIEKVKKIVKYKPFTTKLDIVNLKITGAGPLYRDEKGKEPAKPKKGKKAKKEKGPFVKVEKSGKGVLIKPKGHITLNIPYLPKSLFKIFMSGRALANSGDLQLSIGFKYSKRDRRERVENLGAETIKSSKSNQSYIISAYPEQMSYTMTRSLDREYFIRLSNTSSSSIYVEALSFTGNINSEVKASIIDSTINKDDKVVYIKDVIASFMTKAFRRTPSSNEILKYYGVYQSFSKKIPGMPALLSTYEEILCSPKFLYIGIPGELSESQRDSFRLAEKLSYFLWCSIPDKHLLDDAAKGTLLNPEVLKSHVQRMLKDDRSKRLVGNFTDQWLHTQQLFNVAVDGTYYKGFKDSIKDFMYRETVEAVDDVFRNGSSALNLLKSDHVFVNDVLAKHYRIKGVKGSEFRKVKVSPGDNRGGLLTQGTFLIGNSDGANSHAILRGVWLTEVLLNDPPPAPPKNVPPLDETIPGFNKMTLNQKMFAHRNNDACRNCHNKIDPWGIPFENYDASGAWREKVLVVSQSNKKPKGKKKKPALERSFVAVERASTLPSKDKINGMQDLKGYLVNKRKDDFAEGLTEKILSYALWRDVDFYDAQLVEDVNSKFIKSNFSVGTLIEEIVLSEQFRKRHR